jgi:hypothetical protein
VRRQLSEHIAETRQAIASQPALPPLDALKKKVLSGASWRSFSPRECAALLAEMGFDWNSTGDYLIISKKSLDAITFSAMNGSKLASAAIGTLALTDDEKSAINTVSTQLMDTQLAWDQQHLQRTEPSGDILAQYTLPVDADFSQNQYATFTNAVFSTLGEQRGEWLMKQADQWLYNNGMGPGPDLSSLPTDFMPQLAEAEAPKPTVMTLKADGDAIDLNVQEGGGTSSSTISPWQNVPPPFNTLFPGGWKQIAQEEGFQLPASFNKAGQ